MRRYLAFLIMFASACAKRTPDEWQGVPEADTPSLVCENVSSSTHVESCIGNGKAYTCIWSRADSDSAYWIVHKCARVSALPTPEEPNNDD